MRTRAFVSLVLLFAAGCQKQVVELGSIAVTPSAGRVARGETIQFVATATYSDGTIKDVTSESAWSVDDVFVAASMSTPGLIKGVNEGSSLVRLRFKERTVTRPIAVDPANMRTLQLEPAQASLPVGVGVQLVLTGVDSDGTKHDLTSEAEWTIGTPGIASINGSIATAQQQGTTTIAASARGLRAEMQLTVNGASVTRIDVEPSGFELAVDVSRQLVATAQLSDGSALDVTAQATWSSSAASIVSTSQLPSEAGLVTAHVPGTATITATVLGVSGTATVIAVPSPLVSIELSPLNPTMAIGTLQRFTLTAVFGNGTHADVSGQTAFASNSTAIVSFTNALARANAAGETVIHAQYGGITASTQVRVTSATLRTIELNPTPVTLPVGVIRQVNAMGLFSDGSRQNLTAQAVWTIADGTRARVGNSAGTSGVVSALAQGTTQLTATVGSISATTTLNITAAQLLAMQLTPATVTLPRGTHQRFTATGLYSDSTTLDLSAQATWSASNANVSITAQGTGGGDTTALIVGSSIVTARLGTVSANATVSVTNAVLNRIEVSPASASLPLGSSRDFIATGVFSDGSVSTLTSQVTWSSSDASIASISNTAGSNGHSDALALGTTIITAQLGTMTGTANVTVSEATITRLELSPTSATIAAGLTQDFALTAIYSDASTLLVTSQGIYATANTNIATVSNISPSIGRVSARRSGTTTVSASYQGFTATAPLTITPASVVSMTVSPNSVTLAAGTTASLHVDATFTDGTTADVTSQVSWSSTQPTIATISPSGVVTAQATGTTTAHAQLGTASANASITVTPATLDSLELDPLEPQVPLGATRQLSALGHYSDGTVQNLTAQATWMSDDGTTVSVSNATGSRGIVTANVLGSTLITATFGAETANTLVTVTPATLSRVDITPASPRIAKLTRIRLFATGVWTDGTTQDLTESCTWSSLDTTFATVSNAAGQRGLTSGLQPAEVEIDATCSGIVGSTTLLVTNATLVSIQIAPTAPSAAAGFSASLQATGVFDDGTTQPFTRFVSWSSSAPSTASVSSDGTVQALVQGSATVTATALGHSGSVLFTVNAAVLQSIELTPATATIPRGLRQSLIALGHFSDGTTSSLSESATWNSSAPAIASVSNLAGTRGEVSANAEGTASISATQGGFTATASITVSQAVLVSIDVTPSTPSIAKGQALQFTASGTFSDGSTRDLTNSVTWNSGTASVATVSNAAGSRGRASSLAVGTASISATQSGISGATTLIVTPAELVSIGVTPANPSIPRGLGAQFTATGVYTDSSTQDLTSQVAWSSSDVTVLTISNAPGSEGVSQAVAQGSITVSAMFNGVTGATSVTVSAAVLQQISLTPAHPSTPAGRTATLMATGIYSDATTQDLTASASWSSADTTIATVSGGIVNGVRVGTILISATQDGIVGSVSFDVTAAVLSQIQVTPANASRPKGLAQQFTATGIFSDGSVSTLTDAVTWASSDSAKVSISNANGSRGRASTLTVGTVSISATSGAIVGTTPFTVTAAQLVSLAVTPGGSTAPLGSVRQYTATGTYTDGSTQNLTHQVAWSSSNQTVATVSNANDSAGLATTLSTGATSISASISTFTAASNLLVIQTTLTRIDITPDNGSTALGYTRQLIAIGTYSDGTTQVLTNQVTWSSANESIAFISNANGSRGLLSTVQTGSVQLSATYQSVTGSTQHAVTPAVLVVIALAPGSVTVSTGQNASISATGYFSDGSQQDLTESVTWISANPAVAQVSNASGSRGQTTGIAAGATQVSATQGTVSASLNVTVN